MLRRRISPYPLKLAVVSVYLSFLQPALQSAWSENVNIDVQMMKGADKIHQELPPLSGQPVGTQPGMEPQASPELSPMDATKSPVIKETEPADSALYFLPNQTSITGMERHRHYLKQARRITQALLTFEDRLDKMDGGFNLQQLVAYAQELALLNQAFRKSILVNNDTSHEEEHFNSYRLIQDAVQNIVDAAIYWRAAGRYQAIYRGSSQDSNLDDDIVGIKLQQAKQAILQLKSLQEVQQALREDLQKE